MAQIVALREKHKVLQLYVFGSALTRKFNKNSDIDFIVVFDRESLPLPIYGDNYFDFKFALEDLLKRDVHPLRRLPGREEASSRSHRCGPSAVHNSAVPPRAGGIWVGYREGSLECRISRYPYQ